MIPRDTYKTIEQTPTTETIAFDRWRELGADAVIKGSVRRTGNTFQVEMRLFSVRGRGVALGRVYDNVALQKSARGGAHHLRRHSSDAERPSRRRADEADVRVRSRQRARRRHGRDAQRQRGVRHRLRRREPDARDGESPAEHHARPGRRTAGASRTRRTCAIHPQIIVSNVYQGTRETLTDEKNERPACRSTRPTAAASPSCRSATATRRST